MSKEELDASPILPSFAGKTFDINRQIQNDHVLGVFF